MRQDIQLIYTSRAVSRITASDLNALTEVASQRNRELEITGVLLFGGGRFLQLLEGDSDTVENLYYGKIVKDRRHADCHVLMNEPCTMRLLPEWSMGRLYMQDVQGASQQSWDALCKEIARQNPAAVFARDPSVRIINEFVEHFGIDLDRVRRNFTAPDTNDGQHGKPATAHPGDAA